MKPERWRQIDQLLEAALDHEPEERAAFLALACADDESLRLEVESLLRSDEAAESFIEEPAAVKRFHPRFQNLLRRLITPSERTR
jgi:hypothetical protein